MVLVSFLSDLKIKIVPLRSGEELLTLTQTRIPDLILLDIMMPGGIDGFETCRRLKADESTQDIPVIFMSALTDTFDKVHGLNLGAVDYITKPFETEELLSRLRIHLSIQRLQKELADMNVSLEEKVLARTEELRKTARRLEKEITGHKLTEESLRQSEKKYRELQNNVPLGVFRSTPEGKFVSLNPAMAKLFGYGSTDELFQVKAQKLYKEIKTRETLLEMADKYGVVYDYQTLAKRKDGSTFWMSLNLRMISDGDEKTQYYDGIIDDITDRKQINDELKIAKEKAEESDRMKSAFIAMMSHELRTPLNSIIGFSELINDGFDEEKSVSYANIILKSGNHLLSIIDELLNVTMLENREIVIHKNRFHFEDINNDIIKFISVQQKINSKEHLKAVQVFPKNHQNLIIETDKSKLKQILFVLIKNSIQHTNEGLIEYGYYVENRKVFTFFVKDTGIGIPKDKHDTIFDHFRNANDSTLKPTRGLGIGLSIAKQLVNLLGGRMWVDSEVGKGSTFYFSIPDIKP